MITIKKVLYERLNYLKVPNNVLQLSLKQLNTATDINRALYAYLDIKKGNAPNVSRAYIKQVMVHFAIKYENSDVSEFEEAIKELSSF